MKWIWWLGYGFFSLGCTNPIKSNQMEMKCNGYSQLCERTLDTVAFAATHNSMSSAEDEWVPPNHKYAIPTQLSDGVRGLNLDTYMWEGQAYLCHGFCELGAKPLVDTFIEIETFLQENPNNVIVITFQASISAEETMDTFVQAGLENRLYHHVVGEPWPTLKTLIQKEKQVVAFGSNDGGNLDGYLAQWTHWVDSPYEAQGIEDFACIPNRGDFQTATLYNVNHFISRPIALESFAQEGNINPVLSDHVFSCWEETGIFPNQVLVDFYSIGDLFVVVDALNGIGE